MWKDALTLVSWLRFSSLFKTRNADSPGHSFGAATASEAIKPARFFFNKPTDAATSPTKNASESMAATSSLALFSVFPHPLSTASTATSRTSSRHRPTRSAAVVPRIRCSAASLDLSPGAPAPAPPKPQIELEFLAPKPGADGSYQVDRAVAVSGDKLLRDIMLENKLELYAAYGKLMNCGGTGSCGTCIAEIIEGKELLNERTDTEKRYLKKKPESWRLTCQTIVGNKENSGKVVVQRLPQWKK